MIGIYSEVKWAAVIPLANESEDFAPFAAKFSQILDAIGGGHVFFILDGASLDNTRQLCEDLAQIDPRYEVVWAPENRSLVDAYIRGFRAALERDFELVIEMDAGLSHDPAAIPMFLRVLNEGNECAFGSRYINGGSMADSPFLRRFLSKTGTILAWVFLGSKLHDMTSGFQGFHRNVLAKLVAYPLRSKAHFYQTEVRHLLRKRRLMEVPIHYRAPSPRVSRGAIKDSIKVLLHYWKLRLLMRGPAL